MNHREPPHLPAGRRRALHCLSLLLVPALVLDEGQAGTRLRRALCPAAEPIPYLPLLGSPSLRVEALPPPPDLVTRPPAAAPPTPAHSLTESCVAAANAEAAQAAPAPPSRTASGTPSSAPALPRQSAPILPDTSRPLVRAEDFLPYFQVPGSARAGLNVIVPGVPPGAPAAALPPSSATYTQSPR